MKVLVLGIDALDPRLLLKNIELFPFMREIIQQGVGGAYEAYAYGYGSSDNWTTLYTGLEPKVHGIRNNQFKGIRKPVTNDLLDKEPFWKVLNEAGLTVGVINGRITYPPVNINGYMASSDRGGKFLDSIGEGEVLTPIFNEENRELQKYLKGDIMFPERPRGVEEYGYIQEDLKEEDKIIRKIFEQDNYYEAGLNYLENTLEFFLDNMKILECKKPVDVMWIYTEALDMLQHFQSYAKNKRIIIEAMQKIDKFIGKVKEDLKPDNIIVVSDHGISNIADMLKHDDIEVQREAFGWRDRSFWIDKDTVVSMARNEGFMSGVHDYQGTFLISGKDIKSISTFNNMRSIDFYPTLLELCNVKVPGNRKGYVIDILNKSEYVNEKLRYKEGEKKRIVLIQNLDVNFFNTVINETFLENRFSELTLYCEKKYESIFLQNERLSKVIGVENVLDIIIDEKDYDEMVIGYHNVYFNRILPLTINNKI